MSDYIHNVMWYTVWDAKTGNLVASGTAAMLRPTAGVFQLRQLCQRGEPLAVRWPPARQVHHPAGVHPPQ